MIIELASFTLNMILLGYIRHKARKSHQESTTQCNRLSTSQVNDDAIALSAATSTGHKAVSSAHLATLSTNRLNQNPPNWYNLVIVATNLIFLPYQCLYVLYIYNRYRFSLKIMSICQKCFLILVIIGYSSNIFIFLRFHKVFKMTALEMKRKVQFHSISIVYLFIKVDIYIYIFVFKEVRFIRIWIFVIVSNKWSKSNWNAQQYLSNAEFLILLLVAWLKMRSIVLFLAI